LSPVDQSQQGPLALIFSRQPCFRPSFHGDGQFFVGVGGQDYHIGFGSGVDSLLPQGRITQVIELPPGAFKIEVAEQLFRKAIAELRSSVSGSDVVISDHQVKGTFRVPERISMSGVE
jgi:hypothetical protein